MTDQLNKVWDAVEKVCTVIKGDYERIEVAGSLRRAKPDPHDGEIVLIPKPSLWPRLDELVKAGTFGKAVYGNKQTNRWNGHAYRGLEVDGVTVEIFCAKPETWGYIYWLRTGPGDANQYLVARLWASRLRAQDGGIWYAKDWTQDRHQKWVSLTRQQVRVESERDFFALVGMGYLPPQHRRKEVYERAFESASHRWGDPLPLLMPSATASEKPADQPNQQRLF